MNKSKELAIACIHKGYGYDTYLNHCFTNKQDAMSERSFISLSTTELS